MDDSERDLLNLLDIPLSVLELHAGQLVYTLVNDAACRALGLDHAVFQGKCAHDVYPGRYGQFVYQRHVTAMNTGEKSEFEITLPVNGIRRRFLTTLLPRYHEGRFIHLIGSLREISAEHAIRTLRFDSRELTGEIEQFTHGAAHDLRGSMQNVQSIASRLRENFQDLGDGKIELIDMLETVASKSLGLINDVLNQASEHRTKIPSEASDFSLRALCQDILLQADPSARHKAQITDTRIYAAISDNFYQLIVADNGEGFSDFSSLFLDNTIYKTDSGTLSLAGIRRLVTTRGGVIEAENTEEGAVVKTTLPGRIRLQTSM